MAEKFYDWQDLKTLSDGVNKKNYSYAKDIEEWINKNFKSGDGKRFKAFLVDCINEVRTKKVLEWDKLSLDKRKAKAKKIEKAVNTIISELDGIPKTFKVCDYVQMSYLLADSNIRKSINKEIKRFKEHRRKNQVYIDGIKLSGNCKHVLEETLQDVLVSFVYDVNNFITKKKYKRPNTGEPAIRYAIKYFADFLRSNVLEQNNIKKYPNKFIASCVCLTFPDLSTDVDEKYVENVLKES